MNVTLNLAMDYQFNIKTPLMYLTKAQTWQLADELGVLDYVQNILTLAMKASKVDAENAQAVFYAIKV